MENHGDPILRNKKVTKVATKKRKIKSLKAAAAEKGRTYGIDRLNLSNTAHAENYCVQGEENPNRHDSEWLLTHRMIGYITNKRNKDKIVVH